MKNNFSLKVFAFSTLCSLCFFVGCGGIQSQADMAISQINQLIDAINHISLKTDRISDEWLNKVDETLDGLDSKAKNIVVDELRFTARSAVTTASTGGKANIDYLEEKAFNYLNAVKKGLEAERKRLEEGGKLTGTIDNLLAGVVEEARKSHPPKIDFVNPSAVRIAYTNKFGAPTNFKAESPNGMVMATGHGFLLRGSKSATEADAPSFSIKAVGKDGKERLVSNETNVTANTNYLLTLDLTQNNLVNKLRSTDHKLLVDCEIAEESHTLGSINLQFGVPPKKSVPTKKSKPKVYSITTTTLYCIEQEDWTGSDHWYANIFVDGKKLKKTSQVKIKDGQTKGFAHSLKFKTSVDFYFREADNDGDDNIGHLKITVQNVNNKTGGFSGDGAEGKLSWNVN